MKKLLLVLFVLTAFAANSILCRVALKNGHADPETFSMLRLLGGAAVLFVWHLARGRLQEIRWKIIDALLLCAYVLFFSLAYVQLNTATGALLLFGAVQVCMIGWSVVKGERLSGYKACGILIAVGGIITLLLPGATAPPRGEPIRCAVKISRLRREQRAVISSSACRLFSSWAWYDRRQSILTPAALSWPCFPAGWHLALPTCSGMPWSPRSLQQPPARCS